MPIETITLDIDLIGKYEIIQNISAQSDGEWIFYLHALPSAPLDDLKLYLKIFEQYNYNAIAFNYPGLWQAKGQFSRYDIFTVINAVINHLEQQNPKKVHIFAESFGGLIAFNMIGKGFYNKVKKVVMRAPVTDLRPIGHTFPLTLKYLSTEGILRSDPELIYEHVGEINPPNFFNNIPKDVQIWGVFGRNDEILPAEEMVNATKGFTNINIELWENFPHNIITQDLWDTFMKKAMKFLEN